MRDPVVFTPIENPVNTTAMIEEFLEYLLKKRP